MKWKSLSDNPLEEGDQVMFWHKFWKCPISGTVRGNEVIEITKTTKWPMKAFSHWTPLPNTPN